MGPAKPRHVCRLAEKVRLSLSKDLGVHNATELLFGMMREQNQTAWCSYMSRLGAGDGGKDSGLLIEGAMPSGPTKHKAARQRAVLRAK